MENSASRVSSSPHGEVRIFVKSKNASSELAKEINVAPALIKEVPKLKTKDSNQPVSIHTRSKKAINAVSRYELKEILKSRFSRNTTANWALWAHDLQGNELNIRKKIMPLVFSIIGAVLIGVIMGLSILSLFFSSHANQSGYTIDSHLPKTTLENQMISLPPLNIVMLQAGIYSKQDGARKAVDQLRARGVGAVMSSSTPFRVFLGLAPSGEEAGMLASLYKKQNIRVYQKKLDISHKVGLAPHQQKLGSAIKIGNHIISELSKQSSAGILKSSFNPLNRELSQSYKRFYRESQAVLPHLSVLGREKLVEMQDALNQAVQSVSLIQKNMPSQSSLWEVQEKLVRYVTAYENLVSILSRQ